MSSQALDLVVLTADLDQDQAMRGLLTTRSKSLGIRAPQTKFLKHIRRDPGCFNEAVQVLQPFQQDASYALVVLDRQGCGREDFTALQIEADLETRLARSGWGARARAIAIDPELEIWIWSDSPKVEEVLGWFGRSPGLRDWLRSKGLLQENTSKPEDPKTAFRDALREVRLKPSASIFARLAEEVGLTRCQDPSFLRLHRCLIEWFKPTP